MIMIDPLTKIISMTERVRNARNLLSDLDETRGLFNMQSVNDYCIERTEEIIVTLESLIEEAKRYENTLKSNYTSK